MWRRVDFARTAQFELFSFVLFFIFLKIFVNQIPATTPPSYAAGDLGARRVTRVSVLVRGAGPSENLKVGLVGLGSPKPDIRWGMGHPCPIEICPCPIKPSTCPIARIHMLSFAPYNTQFEKYHQNLIKFHAPKSSFFMSHVP